ncbi:MAG: terminase large subunit domain-containing protein, partial [Lachnospiraceae bacterium]
MPKIDMHCFSPKQRKIMTWWKDERTMKYDGIICDGAIRSGKTSCMGLSFVIWASLNYNGKSFALCGKTIGSLKRNLLPELIRRLKYYGFLIRENASKNYLDITLKYRTNRFYIFGGKDESSSSLIQGITLAGVLLDEVALMPRSF